MTTKNTSKNIKIFECKKCDYICSKKGDWNRHLLTRKHNKTTKTTEITSNVIVEKNIKKEPHYGGINKSVNIQK